MRFFQRKSRSIGCTVQLFLFGGTAYVLLEKLWRGHSHWTMFLLGGVCFHLIGGVGMWCRRAWWVKCGICAAMVTAAEFLCGCLVNLRLHMGVWDYRGYPLQLMGQVCLPYALLWGALSLVAMPLYAACRRLYYR